jgi:hypothetical protein
MARKKKVTAAAAPKPKRNPGDVRARQANRTIVILTPTAETEAWNPYKPTTLAHTYFENMRGGITILQYLAKYTADEQSVARQWLYNMTVKKYVKVQDAA